MAWTDGQRMTRITVAGFLAWLVPGLGHIYLGQRHRGVILLVVIAATFWGGVALGGATETVDPHKRTAWFMAQVSTGAHALVAWRLGRTAEASASMYSWRAEEVAVVYSGVAGLLNLLVILDVLARASQAAPVRVRGGTPSPTRKRAT